MACIYFVRHGQTFWNVDNKVCGRTDIDLTPVGYMTNEEFSKSGIKNCELVRFDYK